MNPNRFGFHFLPPPPPTNQREFGSNPPLNQRGVWFDPLGFGFKPPFFTTDLTLKKMFDMSAKLVGEQDKISNLDTIRWEQHSWKYLSFIGDERIINLQRAKVYVFSDSVSCLGEIHQHPEANEAWKRRIEWIIISQSYRDYDGISGEPTEFGWNIFPGFTTLQLHGKVTDLLSRLGETRQFHRTNSIYVDVQRHFL